jgi:glycosyltransferase involved in cell wall biosynthesis
MAERGHQVLVLAGGEGPVSEQIRSAGVPYRSLRYLRRALHPLRDVLAARELAGAVRGFGPDLMSVHTAKAGWIGRAVAARLGIAVVHTPHGWPFWGRLSATGDLLYERAERVAAKWASVIICVCEAERRAAIGARVARPDQLQVIHNGVRDVAQELRARVELHPPRIVSVARLEAPKDHATLLAALARLKSERWELDLVGEGPLEGRLRRQAAALGIADRVSFLGYVRDPERVLASAQVFALCSRSEGFPRSILEAMRAGLPVVASAVGGVPEAVSEPYTGHLATPGDPVAFAEALAPLLKDTALRRRMSAKARQTYEERFRFELTANRTEALYATLIARGPVVLG